METKDVTAIIDGIIERAKAAKRVNKDGTEFRITVQDAKEIYDVKFPRLIGRGGRLYYDMDKRILSFSNPALFSSAPVVIPEPEVVPDIPAEKSKGKGKSVDEGSKVYNDEAIPKPEVPDVVSIVASETVPAEEEEAPFNEVDGEIVGEKSDYLMWVGYSGYPTIKKFILESTALGTCKRVSRIPKGFVLGKSRVFLAHNEGIAGDAVIFGYFTPTKVEMVVNKASDVPAELKGLVTPVLLDKTYTEAKRGGGYRDAVGALYMFCSSKKPMLEGDGDVTDCNGLMVFDKYRDYNALISKNGTRFRSYCLIDGNVIISSDKVKTAPSERADKTVTFDEAPKAKSTWTDEEKENLELLVEKHGKLYPAFKEFERQSNRTLRSIEYQWFNNHKKAKEAEENA